MKMALGGGWREEEGAPCLVFWAWICRGEEGEAEFSVPFPHSINLAPHCPAWVPPQPHLPLISFVLVLLTPEAAASAWCLLGWLLGMLVPATASELPHPRCKAWDALTHIWNGSCTACLWSGPSSPLQMGQGELASSGHQYTS